MGELKEIVKKVRAASGRAAETVRTANLKLKEHEDNGFQYEAYYKAVLFHELVEEGLDIHRLWMEFHLKKEHVGHFDLGYRSENYEGDEFLLEVKPIKRVVPLNGNAWKLMNPKGIIADIRKLKDYGKKYRGTQKIMVVPYVGLEFDTDKFRKAVEQAIENKLGKNSMLNAMELITC